MAIYLADIVYSDIRDVVVSGSAVTKGKVAKIQDVLGFYLTDGEVGAEVTFVTQAKQAIADKDTGTGEEIVSGDKVYTHPTTGKTSATKGSGYLYSGTAKETVTANATTVLIEFDGTLASGVS
jgi:hypothetical protein